MRILKSILLSCALAVSGQSAVLFTDSFNYPNGSIVGASGSPWSTHSGTAGQANVLSNQLQLVFNESEDINAPLSGGPVSTNSPTILYSSFKVRFTALPAAGSYFAHFKDNTGFGFRGRIYSTTNDTVTTNRFRLGIANATNATAGVNATGGVSLWPADLEPNVTYLVVTRYDVMNGTGSKLWIDPTMESDPSISALDDGVVTNVVDIYQYAFRQATSIGTMLVDDLRIGTTFNDVAGPDQPASITSIANQSIPANGTTPALDFTISDDLTPAGSLVLGKGSSNPALVPTNNIVFGGSGSNRTVTVTPTPGQQGKATVFVTVTDGAPQTTTNAFVVTVGAPGISDIPNLVSSVNVGITNYSFSVSDAEGDPLTLDFTCSNPALVLTSSITLGGAGSNRTLTITPEPAQFGITTITLFVTDGITTNSDSFTFQVAPQLGLVLNERFDRANGPLAEIPANPWLSHSGTFQEMQRSNLQAVLTFSQTEDVSALIPNGPFDPAGGAVLYASFTVNCLQLPTSGGNYFCHFKDDGIQNFRGRVFANTAGAAPGFFRLGIANNATAPSPQFPLDLATNTTYRVVVCYNVANGISKLWVDPDNESSLSVTATDSPSTLSIHTFALRQPGGIGTILFDNLRIGTAYADVAPAIPLNVTTSAGNAYRLSWPAASSNVIAQSASALLPASWANLPAPTVVSNLNILNVTNAGTNLYFRLIAP